MIINRQILFDKVAALWYDWNGYNGSRRARRGNVDSD